MFHSGALMMHGLMSHLMFLQLILGVLISTDASSTPLTLLSNLAKQSETLAHGLKVANLYGNIGMLYHKIFKITFSFDLKFNIGISL